MPRRRPTLALYAAVLLAAAALMAPMLRSERERAWQAVPVPSTYVSGPRGTLALYLLLRDSGVPVARFREPLTRLPLEGGPRLLVVAGPSRKSVAAEEATSLRRWVDGGNTLVWLAGREPWREAELRRVFEAPEEGLSPAQLLGLTGKPMDLTVSGETAYGDGVDLLSAASPSSGALPGPVVPPADPGAPKGAPPGGGGGEDTLPLPGALPGPAWVPLAGVLGEGPVVLKRRVGDGELFLLPATLFLDNEGITRSENLDFFLGILELHRPAEVLFDEVHHGREPHPLGGLGRDPRFWAGLGQVAGLAGLYAASRLRRLGPARPYLRDDRRPAADYVRALGNLFRKGRKGPDAARSLWRSFRARLERRTGLPQRLEDAEVARALAGRAGARGWRLAPLLEAAREGKVKGERELLEVARTLRRVEEEVERWRKR